MATISMYKLIFVLPVPTTAFNQTTETLIKIIAKETTRITGIAASINSSPYP